MNLKIDIKLLSAKFDFLRDNLTIEYVFIHQKKNPKIIKG